MYDGIDDLFVFNLKVELLVALARRSLLRRFMHLNLSTHELPQSALRLMCSTLTDKIPVAILDDGAHNFNYAFLIHTTTDRICNPFCIAIPAAGLVVGLCCCVFPNEAK